jgi:hypothetical protein
MSEAGRTVDVGVAVVAVEVGNFDSVRPRGADSVGIVHLRGAE